MKSKVILLLTCLFLGTSLMTAQGTEITGSVISGENGLPVAGASVTVKGSTTSVATDMNGKFALSNGSSTAKTLSVETHRTNSHSVWYGL